MAHEEMKLLISEAEKMHDEYNSKPDKDSVHATRQYTHQIARLVINAKEKLNEDDFSLFLDAVGLDRDTANWAIDKLLRDEFYRTQIEPLGNRYLEARKQMHKIMMLNCENEQPHYTKMISSLYKELYELAKEMDNKNATYEVKDALQGLLPSQTWTEALDEHFELLERLATDEEYRRKFIASMKEED